MEDTYTVMRHFADSWALAIMFALFVGIVIFVFRPSARKMYKDTAQIPLRDDTLERDIEHPVEEGK